ncbi:ASKHA domain-containing protein [Planctomycetota bacterium]
MKHFSIKFEPDGKEILIHEGAALLEAASRAGIILNTPCGGEGICGKCLVILKPDAQQVKACQHRIEGNLTVTIPASSRFFEHRILTEGIETKVVIQPDIYTKYLKAGSAGEIYGLAVDIGTTTVVAKLINMTNGQSLASASELNPQARLGDNVISRISYAQTNEKLAELHKLIIDCINELTGKLCRQASIEPEKIYEICAVGNTTMNHIFLNLPVKQLGHAPYKPALLDAGDKKASDILIAANEAANVHTPPNIAGFVGSDINAVALAVDIESSQETTLVVDIGTNGELVLACNGSFYAASCAAGPALEGAGISCGSMAAVGAIEAVFINEGDVDIDVIGDVPPRSICGSGLLDAATVLLDLGVIDSTGRFVDPDKLKDAPSAILARITKIDGQPAFVLADTADGKLLLTQNDIRQIQLAKGAIRAGIKLLQLKVGIEDSDIKQIFLAGAFGNYIRAESALRIGLLPDVSTQTIHFVGNAAASGAQMILLSSENRKKARDLARKIQYIEIGREKDFETIFAESMTF